MAAGLNCIMRVSTGEIEVLNIHLVARLFTTAVSSQTFSHHGPTNRTQMEQGPPFDQICIWICITNLKNSFTVYAFCDEEWNLSKNNRSPVLLGPSPHFWNLFYSRTFKSTWKTHRIIALIRASDSRCGYIILGMTPIDVGIHCWHTVKGVSVPHNAIFVFGHVLLFLFRSIFNRFCRKNLLACS